jgi:type IV secretory pathway VirB2 component (pilin)
MKLTSLAGKFPRLVLAYAAVGIVVLAASAGLYYLTGYIYRNAQVIVGGELMVDNGKVYHSLYTEELIWHAVAALLIVTAWHLMSDRLPDEVNRIGWFLTSRRVNVIAGILFIFAGLGLLFGKSGLDPVTVFVVLLDLALVSAVVLRVVWREIYLWQVRHGRQP